MSVTKLFGPADPHAPVVIFVAGDLECPMAREEFIGGVQGELQRAAQQGVDQGLEDALNILTSALEAPLQRRALVVVRGGERPVLLELAGWDRLDRSAKFLVRPEPPPWLDSVAHSLERMAS